MSTMTCIEKVNQEVSRTRRLKFSHTTQVCFVPGLWEMNTEEIKNSWLTDEDNAKIQINTLKTVKRMRRGKSIDGEKYCARGLEHMQSAAYLEERKNNKASVCNAVLAEQRRQTLSGCHDSIKLRNVSALHSKVSREEALRIAACDAVAAGIQEQTGPSRISSQQTENVHVMEYARGLKNSPQDNSSSICLTDIKLPSNDTLKRTGTVECRISNFESFFSAMSKFSQSLEVEARQE